MSSPRQDVGRLKDERVAKEFSNRPSGDLGDLGVLRHPEELWSAFKTTVLYLAGRCLEPSQAKKNLISQRRLGTIDQSQGQA